MSVVIMELPLRTAVSHSDSCHPRQKALVWLIAASDMPLLLVHNHFLQLCHGCLLPVVIFRALCAGGCVLQQLHHTLPGHAGSEDCCIMVYILSRRVPFHAATAKEQGSVALAHMCSMLVWLPPYNVVQLYQHYGAVFRLCTSSSACVHHPAPAAQMTRH